MKQKFFLFAGEKSGDLLGGHLLKSLNKEIPGCILEGVGGPEMRDNGLKCIMRTEQFEVMGFSEILKSYFKLRRQFYFILDHILKSLPDCVILIDYPGFNLRMAKALREKGFKGKIVQYVSPTVWAWGKDRIGQMAGTLDLLLTIYPFESPYFKNTPLKAEYVGNPIKEIVSKHEYDQDWAHLFGIKDTRSLVAIFPGSRKGEIQLNLPSQLRAAELLKKQYPETSFVVSCAHEKIMPVMYDILRDNTLKLNKDVFLLPKAYTYELMQNSKAAIAKSGTVTLELALHNCPTVVVYKLTWLNRMIAKYLLHLNLPYYCIVNILKQKAVFPELIEKSPNPHNIFRHLKSLYEETPERSACLKDCASLKEILQDDHASEQAAQKIKELLTA